MSEIIREIQQRRVRESRLIAPGVCNPEPARPVINPQLRQAVVSTLNGLYMTLPQLRIN